MKMKNKNVLTMDERLSFAHATSLFHYIPFTIPRLGHHVLG